MITLNMGNTDRVFRLLLEPGFSWGLSPVGRPPWVPAATMA